MKTSGEKLKDLRERTPLSIRAMAEAIGMNYGTYNSRESRSKKQWLEYDLAEKVIPVLAPHGISPEEVMALVNPNAIPTADAELNRPYRVLGFVQAGVWSEAVELPYDDQRTVIIPTGEHPNADDFFVLQARGDSMNKAGITDGSYVVCLPMFKYEYEPETGDLVIAQRSDGHGHYESTVKQLEIKPDGSHWLWPRSDNPEYQQPIKVPPPSEWPDDLHHCSAEETCVSAVVMGVLPSFAPPMST